MGQETRRGDGRRVPTGAGVVPILKEIGEGQLKVVGTGFFVTRYGLFATAKHVLEELVEWDIRSLFRAFVLRDDAQNLLIRQITGLSLSDTADVAIGQADNRVGRSVPQGHQISVARYPFPGHKLVKL